MRHVIWLFKMASEKLIHENCLKKFRSKAVIGSDIPSSIRRHPLQFAQAFHCHQIALTSTTYQCTRRVAWFCWSLGRRELSERYNHVSSPVLARQSPTEIQLEFNTSDSTKIYYCSLWSSKLLVHKLQPVFLNSRFRTWWCLNPDCSLFIINETDWAHSMHSDVRDHLLDPGGCHDTHQGPSSAGRAQRWFYPVIPRCRHVTQLSAWWQSRRCRPPSPSSLALPPPRFPMTKLPTWGAPIPAICLLYPSAPLSPTLPLSWLIALFNHFQARTCLRLRSSWRWIELGMGDKWCVLRWNRVPHIWGIWQLNCGAVDDKENDEAATPASVSTSRRTSSLCVGPSIWGKLWSNFRLDREESAFVRLINC